MDAPIRVGQDSLLSVMRPNRLDPLDKAYGPPERVAQFLVPQEAYCRACMCIRSGEPDLGHRLHSFRVKARLREPRQATSVKSPCAQRQ
jgi:hypothetical protein